MSLKRSFQMLLAHELVRYLLASQRLWVDAYHQNLFVARAVEDADAAPFGALGAEIARRALPPPNG
jgi:hypothetical protein